ncbi:hypothetical protein DXG01_015782 [Tephrocybe rancida]|nr:hypothetical protein DXG01_015782 [Tephrocybe rancida]
MPTMTGHPTYGKEEKKVIKAHKMAFQEAHDMAGRDRVVWDLILPELLAFYKRTNHPHVNAAEGDVGIVKELKEWTSNNWWKTGTAKDSEDVKVNIAVIVERMFQDRVNETLHDLVGVEELGQDPQREFQLRNRAIKMVRKNLSPEEMVSVNAEKARVASSGNPLEKQRYCGNQHGWCLDWADGRVDARGTWAHKVASGWGPFCTPLLPPSSPSNSRPEEAPESVGHAKYLMPSIHSLSSKSVDAHLHYLLNLHGQSRIDAEDKKWFMEMGMLSLTLVAWVDSTGEFKVQAHDSMVFLKGSQKDTFAERNTNFVNEMLRKFLQYIFYLHDIVCVAPNIGAATTVTGTGVAVPTPPEPSQQVILEMDSRGFPRLPGVFPGLTKDLVKLCHEYMNAQYSIASGKPDSRMCVAELCANPKSFIAGGCLPKDWDMTGNVRKNSTKKILRDPQNMDKGMLLDLLEHWRLWEKAHGCATALQFTHFMRGKECLPTVIAPAHTNNAMVSPWKKSTMKALDMNSQSNDGSVTQKMATTVTETGNEISEIIDINPRPAHLTNNELSTGIQRAPANRKAGTPPNSTTGKMGPIQGHNINEGATETTMPPNKNMGTMAITLPASGDPSTDAQPATDITTNEAPGTSGNPIIHRRAAMAEGREAEEKQSMEKGAS